MRRLFEGGVTNVKTLAAGGDYSRAATIRGLRLIDEIRYVYVRGQKKLNHTLVINSPFQTLVVGILIKFIG